MEGRRGERKKERERQRERERERLTHGHWIKTSTLYIAPTDLHYSTAAAPLARFFLMNWTHLLTNLTTS